MFLSFCLCFYFIIIIVNCDICKHSEGSHFDDNKKLSLNVHSISILDPEHNSTVNKNFYVHIFASVYDADEFRLLNNHYSLCITSKLVDNGNIYYNKCNLSVFDEHSVPSADEPQDVTVSLCLNNIDNKVDSNYCFCYSTIRVNCCLDELSHIDNQIKKEKESIDKLLTWEKNSKIENDIKYDSSISCPYIEGSNPSIAIGIKSGSLNFSKRQAIRDTWLKNLIITNLNYNISICAAFILGKSSVYNQINKALSLEKSIYNDILIGQDIPVMDSYYTLPQKVVNFMLWIKQQRWKQSIQYIIICDDDVYIHAPSLVQLLYGQTGNSNKSEGVSRNRYYAGEVGNLNHIQRPMRDIKHANNLPYEYYSTNEILPFALGNFYILSSDLVDFITNNVDYLRSVGTLEDVSIAVWMSALGILPKPLIGVCDAKSCNFYNKQCSSYSSSYHNTFYDSNRVNHVEINNVMIPFLAISALNEYDDFLLIHEVMSQISTSICDYDSVFLNISENSHLILNELYLVIKIIYSRQIKVKRSYLFQQKLDSNDNHDPRSLLPRLDIEHIEDSPNLNIVNYQNKLNNSQSNLYPYRISIFLQNLELSYKTDLLVSWAIYESLVSQNSLYIEFLATLTSGHISLISKIKESASALRIFKCLQDEKISKKSILNYLLDHKVLTEPFEDQEMKILVNYLMSFDIAFVMFDKTSIIHPQNYSNDKDFLNDEIKFLYSSYLYLSLSNRSTNGKIVKILTLMNEFIDIIESISDDDIQLKILIKIFDLIDWIIVGDEEHLNTLKTFMNKLNSKEVSISIFSSFSTQHHQFESNKELLTIIDLIIHEQNLNKDVSNSALIPNIDSSLTQSSSNTIILSTLTVAISYASNYCQPLMKQILDQAFPSTNVLFTLYDIKNLVQNPDILIVSAIDDNFFDFSLSSDTSLEDGKNSPILNWTSFSQTRLNSLLFLIKPKRVIFVSGEPVSLNNLMGVHLLIHTTSNQEMWPINHNSSISDINTKTIFFPVASTSFAEYVIDNTNDVTSFSPRELLSSQRTQEWVEYTLSYKTKSVAYLYCRCDRSYRDEFYDILSEEYKNKNYGDIEIDVLKEDFIVALGSCSGKISKDKFNKNNKGCSSRFSVNYLNLAIEMYKPFKFVVAFENRQDMPGYISEKITNAYLAGSIPIYFGAPDIDKYFNPNSMVDCNKFPTLRDCALKVIEIDNNDALYQKMISEAPVISENILNDLFSWHKENISQKTSTSFSMIIRKALN
jgi:hypothetical protein